MYITLERVFPLSRLSVSVLFSWKAMIYGNSVNYTKHDVITKRKNRMLVKLFKFDQMLVNLTMDVKMELCFMNPVFMS